MTYLKHLELTTDIHNIKRIDLVLSGKQIENVQEYIYLGHEITTVIKTSDSNMSFVKH